MRPVLMKSLFQLFEAFAASSVVVSVDRFASSLSVHVY